MKRVIRGELPDAWKAADVDGNVQRNYVTIRPLNREDSVLYFPPEAFGPFRVLHQIGAGTLGPVFRAYESGRDRLVAIKVFRLDLTPEQAAALAGELDALTAAGLNHPNIAAPIAAGLENGAAYLAQEYAVGDSLDVVLRERGPLPIQEAVPLVASLASAIDHAAAKGVHHGALHPRDIILSADGARISGFGLAAALSGAGVTLPSRPSYAFAAFAPETPIASAGKPADDSSDVYSLAAIVFEALTGRGVSPEALKEFEADHGAELGGAFRVALIPNSDLRPERAGDFADVLRDAAEMTAEADAGALEATRLPAETMGPAGADAAPDDLDLRFEPEPMPFPQSWPGQPPRALHLTADPAERHSRRWQVAVAFLAFAVVAALSVGLFLKSPTPVAIRPPEAGVDETTVDIPAGAPVTRVPAPPASTPPPAPSPSRPASGAVARTEKPATGSLLIRSTPADAAVMLNGRARGQTPLALRDLALGSYTIRVAREGYAAGERTLRLTPGQPAVSTTFDLRPASAQGAAARSTRGTGGVTVQSRPAGARVWVNNRLVGSTPLAVPGLPAGPATVRIELDGYQQWVTTVRVSAGGPTRVAASLERK